MLRISSVLLIISLFMAACGNNNKQAKQQQQADSSFNQPQTAKENILFFGTSLTAGYGLEDASQAYPALIQNKIDSLNLPYHVINGGLSGETSAGGLSRIDWILKQPVNIFILELGANDGLRGISVKETTSNLQAIIDKVKAKYPDAKLVMEGMQMPPNMGDRYTSDFKELFNDLAKKNHMLFVPFLLDGVGGVPKLNQNDGIHPNKEGAKVLAENVWKVLKPTL
nr:arylesterase [Pseudopedobacter sp.]